MMESTKQEPQKDSTEKVNSLPPLIKIERVFSLSEEEFAKTKEEKRPTNVVGKEDDYLQAFSEAFKKFSKDIVKTPETSTPASPHRPSSTPSYLRAGLLKRTLSESVPSKGELFTDRHKKPRLDLEQFVSSPSEQESSFISQLQRLHSYTDSDQESAKKFPRYEQQSKAATLSTRTPADKHLSSNEKPYQVLNTNKGLPALIRFSDKPSEQSREGHLMERYRKYLAIQNREQKPRLYAGQEIRKRRALSDYFSQLRRHQFDLNEKRGLNTSTTSVHAGGSYQSVHVEAPKPVDLTRTESAPKTLRDEKSLQRRKKLHDMIEEIKRSCKTEYKDTPDDPEDDMSDDETTRPAEEDELLQEANLIKEDPALRYNPRETEAHSYGYNNTREGYIGGDVPPSLAKPFMGGFTGRLSPDDPDLYKPRTYKRLESGKPSALERLEDKLRTENFLEETESEDTEQKSMKLERKRYLSRIASYKSRKKRLEREERLAHHVEGLKEEKIRLEMMKSFAKKELQEVRGIIRNHLHLGCDDKQVIERLVYSLNNFS